MKRKLCESGITDEDLFSDLSDEESYISAVDKMENEYFKGSNLKNINLLVMCVKKFLRKCNT